MAVNIPVVIDIDKAFEEAASRVNSSMAPLQRAMDQNALAIRLHVDDTRVMMVKDILSDSTLSAKQLNTSLSEIDAKIMKAASHGGFDLANGLKESEKIMLQAAGALEAKIHGVRDSSAVMSRIFAANINKTKIKIQELSAQLDALTRKQNFNVKKISSMELAPKGTGKTFEKTKAQIESVNQELIATKNYLGSLEIELAKVSKSGISAATSIAAMKTPAMELAEQWRVGATYVDRYNASLGVANSKLLMLIKSSLSLVAIHSAVSFIRNVRNVTAEFEMQRVALGGIIQDTERAESLFKQLKAAAIQSPFEIKDLVTFTKQLSAYRIETENLFDVTMRLADISAGLGVDMNRLVLAYGQVRAASVLRGQELRQFTEAGIPLVELLAEKFRKLGREGTTTADVFELISKRAVPFSMIEEIFRDMTDAGGIFYKMQEKQSETLKGQWMKLKDALSIMYDEIGNTKVVHDAMTSLLRYSMQLLQNWRELGRTIGVVVSAFVAYKIAVINARIAASALTATEMAQVSALQLNVVGRSRLIASLFGETAATKAQIFFGNLYVKAKTKEMMATNLFTRALWRMNAALLSNPYAIAIAGIVALIAVIGRLISSSKEATVSVDGLQKQLTNFDKVDSHAKDVNALCDAYDKLAQKANRTKDEEEKLTRITNELTKSYPDAIKGVDEHTKALKVDTKAIRKRNDAIRESLKLELERDVKNAEKTLKQYQSEYDRIGTTLEKGTITKMAYGGVWEETITEAERSKLNARLLWLADQIKQFQKAVNSAEDSMKKFKQEVSSFDVPLPEFFGDDWRLRLASYSTFLEGAIKATKAFTPDQIRQFKSLEDGIGEAIKQYQELEKSVTFYTNALANATDAEKKQLSTTLNNTKSLRDMYADIITYYNAWYLLQKSKSAYSGKDPFVEQIQNRIKFMKDFKKGYDDLNAYLSSTEALDIQSGIMFGRGQSLGLSKEEQNRAAEGLSEWYEDMIKKVQQRMRAKGAKGVTVNDLLGLSIPEANKQLRALQQLLQQLWDAKTDFDTDQKKKDLEKAIATLAEEVKRTETAKNFYNDILGLTGDTDMAATMSIAVYGDTGADFRDKIKEQLQDAFVIEPQKVEADNLNVEEVQREIDKAINTGDYGALAKYLKYVEDKYKGTAANIVNNWQKENAELAKGYDKLLLKYDEIERKRVDVTQKAAKDRETIQKGLNLELAGLQKEYEDALPQASSPMAKSALKAAYDMAVKQAQERAKGATEAIDREEKMELYKLSHDYRMFFSSINVLSEQTARAIRATVREQLADQYLAGDITLEQYERSLRELDERYKKYENRKGFLYTYLMGGVEGAVNLKKELADDMKAVAKEIEDAESPFAVPEASQEFIDHISELYGKKIFDGAEIESYEDLVKQSGEDTKKMAKAITDASNNLRENAEATSQGWGWAAFWVTNVSTLIQELGQFNTELDEASPAWLDAVASLATWTLGRTDDAFDRLSALNEKATSGFQKLQQGNIVGAIADNVRGLIDFWGPNMRRINARIKEQEHLLEELSYSYDRLRDAEESAFGADYISNYEARLKALQAEQTAYQRQAELERDKGKKRDKDKIRDYEKSARDVADQIAEMQGEVAQKLLGTDLSSAARDFASSWIEAYKEFGSTTDAIKAKFNDMLQNMVIESLAARVVEQQLSPIFDEIDRLATEGGELSIVDAKVIADKAQVAVGTINTGMTNLMNALSAAGMNVRTMGSGLTGIAKDIQGASEESILGLAAGVNTQNFYLQQISGNVAAILQQMRPGGETTTPAVVEIPYVEGDVFRSRMESLDSNIATILQRLDSVITPKNTNSNTHCIAIK